MDPRKTFTMFLHSARLPDTPILSSNLSLGTPMQVVAFTDFTFPSLKIKNGLFKQFEPIQVDAISEMQRAKVIIKGESA